MGNVTRIEKIRNLISGNEIGSQKELAGRLKASGLRFSQSTLSRDLKNLGVQKVRTPDGKFVFQLPEAKPAATSLDEFKKRFTDSVLGIRRSGFVLLLFTPPGEAQLVGRLLDHLKPEGLLGNVSGDDTIICIVDSPKRAKTLEKELRKMLP